MKVDQTCDFGTAKKVWSHDSLKVWQILEDLGRNCKSVIKSRSEHCRRHNERRWWRSKTGDAPQAVRGLEVSMKSGKGLGGYQESRCACLVTLPIKAAMSDHGQGSCTGFENRLDGGLSGGVFDSALPKIQSPKFFLAQLLCQRVDCMFMLLKSRLEIRE